MTIEEKINHLRNYLEWKIDDHIKIVNRISFYFETGMTITDISGYAPKTFDEYLKLIWLYENN